MYSCFGFFLVYNNYKAQLITYSKKGTFNDSKKGIFAEKKGHILVFSEKWGGTGSQFPPFRGPCFYAL